MRQSLHRTVKLLPSRWPRIVFQHCTPEPLHALLSRHALASNRQVWTNAESSATTRDELAQRVTQLSATRNEAIQSSDPPAVAPVHATPFDALPLICPGCGAPSQIVDATAPGYYNRKQTQKPENIIKKLDDEDGIFAAALERGAIKDSRLPTWSDTNDETPICDRCHYLVHENIGHSIIHPSIESIRAMIEESPHRHNHIYHIIDAVDFPMSLIPDLQTALHLPRLRSQNRRSKHKTFIKGRVAEVSFIITRADLLAPKKEQVDALLPYMRNILRDSLGRAGKNVRLGNVRMVSARRGWWTPVLKEEIYRRGGAGWMVGKANVGKSSLIEVVYPKGKAKGKPIDFAAIRAEAVNKAKGASSTALFQNPRDAHKGHADQVLYQPTGQAGSSTLSDMSEGGNEVEEDFTFDESELTLLPPAPKETAYPTMPIISALPGTTASPIRLPFGNGRGELVDLPGVERSLLSEFVLPDYHKQLIMHHRTVPIQHVVRPGQSLLLGGLIRITPKTDVDFMMYAFVPSALQPHTTSTEKAVAISTGSYETGEPYYGHAQTSAREAAKSSMQSAGVFQLQWDVTKQRGGALTDRTAGKMKPQNLPFLIYATDLLIEGVGWVEIVAQVRRPRQDVFEQSRSVVFPEVEVFSPHGAFVDNRRPMNGWLLGRPRDEPVRKRPRQTISYKKRMEGGRAGAGRQSTTE